MRRLGGIAVLTATALVLGVPTTDAATTLGRRVVPGAKAAYTPLTYGPGDPTLVRGDLAAPKPGRARRRTSLTYFAQLSDFQLADEESPARVESLDQVNSAFSAAWRPQEALMPFVIDASIRQVDANLRSPIRARGGRRAKLAFTLLTGDNADNKQANEAGWVDRLLMGGRLDPGSGVVDDASMAGAGCGLGDRAKLAAEAPLYTGVQDYDDYLQNGTFWDPDVPLGQFAAFPSYPGLMDRAQQPFMATGLRVKSYVAFGNHDGLVQGNLAANSTTSGVATGCVKALTPTLNPSDPVALIMDAMIDPAGSLIVPPDPERREVDKADYRKMFAGDGQADQHGFGDIDPAERKASDGAASYYSFAPRKG
ncbi:MAG: hypothetical protein QOF76_1795, partial [Solirubrobacteraceae bacterium]|nr:hypothetical protein [Solirubrobacteraceae bacterium]